MSTVERDVGTGTAERHPMRSGLVALMASWFFVATGEALYGTLDRAEDIGAIGAAATRFGAGALLQVVAAILLAVGVAALMAAVRPAAPRLSTVGGWIGLTGAVGVGAFAQFHLVLLAMTDASLDTAAINAFLNGPLQTGGLWGIPILFVLAAVPLGLLLLALGAAHAGIVSRWPAILIGVYTVVHLAGIPGVDGEWSEVGSHYFLAVVLAWIGIAVLRTRSADHPEPASQGTRVRRSAVTAALLAVFVMVFGGVAAARPVASPLALTLDLSCGTPQGPSTLNLLTVSSGHLGWDADSPATYQVKGVTQTFHATGEERSMSWGRFDTAAAWNCTTGPIRVQGFDVTFDLVLVPMR
jgi:hypothetical protein